MPNPFASQPPKKSKKTTIALVCVLLLLAFGVGAYLLFFDKTEPQVANQPQNTTKRETPGPTNNPSQDTPVDEETEITDEALLADLNYKVAVLLEDHSGANVFVSPSLTTNVDSLFENSADDGWRQTDALRAKEAVIDTANGSATRTAITNFVKEATEVASEPTYLSMMERTLDGGNVNAASYAEANSFYKELFGKTDDLPKTNLIGNKCTRYFFYIPEIDSYINRASLNLAMCGGTGYPWIFTKKDNLTAKGDEAYVNVRIVTSQVDPEKDGTTYTRSFYNGYGDSSSLTKIRDTEDFHEVSYTADSVSESDFDTAQKYRFVFKKSPSGIYYFDKLEKL